MLQKQGLSLCPLKAAGAESHSSHPGQYLPCAAPAHQRGLSAQVGSVMEASPQLLECSVESPPVKREPRSLEQTFGVCLSGIPSKADPFWVQIRKIRWKVEESQHRVNRIAANTGTGVHRAPEYPGQDLPFRHPPGQRQPCLHCRQLP